MIDTIGPGPGCRFCGVAYTRNFTEYTMQIWDDERGARTLAKFHVCSAARCRTLAEKDVGAARMNVERHLELARQQAVVERLAPAAEEYHGAIGALTTQRQCHHQTFDQRVEIDEAEFHAAAERIRAEQPEVSTGSALVGVMRNESSPFDARFAVYVNRGAPDARRCSKCLADLTPLTSWLHSLWLPGCATAFVTCTKDDCMAWAQRFQEDAETARRRAREIPTDGVPVAKAPAPEQLPAVRARLDEIRREPSRPLMLDADPPAPRPDGFAQSQVDAAKAALLSHVPRRGAR